MNPVQPNSNVELSLFEGLPLERQQHVFAYLPICDIGRCTRLSSCLQTSLDDQSFWHALAQSRLSSYTIEVFNPLVERKVVTWREVFCYQSLLTLFTETAVEILSDRAHITQNNPQMSLNSMLFCKEVMPQPVAFRDGWFYSISNCFDVEQRKGDQAFTLTLVGSRLIAFSSILMTWKSISRSS